MADAFRGLTIRIGADARPVKSALDSIRYSAGITQKQFNKMTKALRFDPTNVKALEQAITLAEDKAAHMAMSMRTAQTAIDQAADKMAGFGEHSEHAGKSISEAASSIKNINAHIQQTREESKTVNAQLQHIYDSAKKIVESRLHAPFATAEQKARLADDVVKQIQRDLASTGAKADSAFQAMNKFITEATTSKGMNLSEKFGLGKTEADAEQLYQIFVKLRHKSSELDSDLKALKNVAGFQALTTEVIAYESALREAVTETVRYKAELAKVGTVEMSRALASVKNMRTATQAAAEQARVMDAAYAAMPKSVEAARNKIVSTRGAQQALKEEAKSLETVLSNIEKTPGFDKVAASMSNVHVEFEKAKTEAIQAETAIKLCEDRIKQLNHQKLDLNMSESDLDEMISDIEKAEHELTELKEKAAEADIALDRAAKNKEFADVSTDLARVNTELAELNARSSVLNKFKNLGNGLREFGFGLYASVTPAIMMAGRYAIQAADDIDSAYRDMRKTVNGTEEDFEHLRDAALEFSTTHVTSADTMLEIEAMGGQLGIAVENLEAFGEVVSNLDIATDIGAEDMAKYLGQLSNIMDDIDQHNPAQYQKDITSFSDALVRLGNNSAAQESSIMKVMMRIASIGNISGMTTPQLLAISTAVAATGQGCEAAGTAISKTFSNIEAAVSSGGIKLQAFADVAGMTAEEYARAWNETPMEAFDAFITGLKRIDAEGGSVDQTLAKLGINSVRQKQALMGLTNTLDVMHESLGMSQTAWDGLSYRLSNGKIEQAGDAAREAQRKSEGFSGALKILTNQAMALGNALADGAAPIVKSLGTLFGDLTKEIMKMPDGMKTAIVGILGFTAAIGPASVALGTLMKAGSSIVGTISGIGSAFVKGGAHIADAGMRVKGLAMTMSAAEGSVTKSSMAMNAFGNSLLALGSGGNLALATAGIAALGGVVATIAGFCIEAAAHQEKLSLATDGLRDAANSARTPQEVLGEAISTTSVAATQAVANMGKYREATDSLIEKGGQLAQSFRDQESSANGTIGLIQYYSEKVQELAGHCEGDAQKVEQLKTALAQYNNLTGSNFKIVDEYTGAIDGQTDAIQRNTEAAKLNAYAKAYSSILEESIKHEAEVTAEYEKQEQAASDLRARIAELAQDESNYVDVVGDNGQVTRMATGELAECNATMTEINNTLPELKEQMGAASETTAIYEEKVNAMNEALQQAKEGVAVARYSVSDYTRELEAAQRASSDFGDIARKVGYENLAEFATSLSKAGISAEDFASISMENFLKLATAAEGDLGRIGTAIELVNARGLDPKDLTINAEGLPEIKGMVVDVDNLKIGDKQFEMTANGLKEVKEGLEQIDGAEVSAEANLDGSAAEEELGNLEGMADEWDERTATAEAEMDEEEALQSAENAKTAAESYEREYTAKADLDTSAADSALNGLIGRLEAFGRNTYTAKVGAAENAAGGIFRMNAVGALSPRAVRAIPRNASGAINGIVSRPTLTNIGWVGEAGAEAVLHMRNAGGAVIPLSNRHYVRPFARAVASEMGGGTRNVTVNLTLDYKAGDDADKLARGVASRLEAIMNMEA